MIYKDVQDCEPPPLDNQPYQGPSVKVSENSLRWPIFKLLVAAGLVLVIELLISTSPQIDILHDVQRLKGWLNEAGGYGPILFVVPAALLVAGGIPRMLMASAAGVLLGFCEGFFFAWSVSLAGAYMNFLLFRWGARDLAKHLLQKAPRFNARIRNPGVVSVVLVRQLPMWGVAQNAALAATDVRHREFLAGTLLGILPTTLIITLISSGVGKADLAHTLWNVGSAMILLLLFAVGVRKLNKRRTAKGAND